PPLSPDSLSLHDALPILSKPSLVPSRSMLVTSSSPAPAAAIRCAHSTASRPVAVRPPWVNTSQRGGSPGAETRLASMATTMHCRSEEHTSELQSRENLVC